MECIQKYTDIGDLKNNQFICNKEIEFINSKIIFNGSGNVILINTDFLKDGEKLKFSKTDITFFGNNNLLFINAGQANYTFSLNMYHNSVCHIGANNYFNPYGEILRLRCSEEKNIFIGDDGMFSTGVEIVVSDSHLIFDCKSFNRLNYAKSVYIGDHVWLGRQVSVMKGAQIGSGAIVGAHSVVTKKIPSNTSWAGIPAKQKGTDVFFVGYNAMPYQKNDIELHSTYQSDRWIFSYSDDTVEFNEVEADLNKLAGAMDKAEYLLNINKYKRKNRFFIPKTN